MPTRRIPAPYRRAAVCSVLAFTLLLAGCGDRPDDPPVDVTVWMYPVITDPRADAAYWEGIEKKFQRAAPGVRLNVERMPWAGRDARIAEALAGESGPDAILLMPDQIPFFTSRGALAPIEAALKGDVDKFLPTARNAVTVGDRIYGAPIYQTVTTTIYNKRLLSDAGVATPPPPGRRSRLPRRNYAAKAWPSSTTPLPTTHL